MAKDNNTRPSAVRNWAENNRVIIVAEQCPIIYLGSDR